MHTQGMAATIEQLDRCAPANAPAPPVCRLLTVPRRARAIEQELYKRADGDASCAELAAVLHECDTPRPCCRD